MVSYDVKDLFTNIPLTETISIIIEYLYPNADSTFLGMKSNYFKKLLEIAVGNSFFIFNKQLYKQKDGLGIGLPLSPSLANIFLSYHEQKWLDSCPKEFSPVFYRRYVDDTFVLFKKESHAKLFHEFINDKHPNIKFTMEVENNNKLSFLDVLINRYNDDFITSVFRKETFSGLGSSFFSFCPEIFKVNAIRTLIYRAYHLSSSYATLHGEFRFLISYFKKNGYPSKLVESCIMKFLTRIYSNYSNIIQQDITNKHYFSFPFFGAKSIKLQKELNVLLAKHFTGMKSVIVMVNKYKIATLFNHKDRVPDSMQSSLVYKYSCARCASVYIGSTLRSLNVRSSEHCGNSFRTGQPLTNPSHSNIRDHSLKCGSPLDLNNFSKLASCPNVGDLRILESLYIHRLKPKLNSSQTAHPLYVVK